MQFSSNKQNITYLGVAILVLIVVGLVFLNRSSVLSETTEEEDNTLMQTDSKLSNREIAIQNALTYPESLPTAEVSGNTFLLTGYAETKHLDNSHDNKPGRKFGGILLFKLTDGRPELFWESNEYIGQPYVRFEDVDGDTAPEIVWSGDLGVTGRNYSFYVYKLIGNEMTLITPVETKQATISSAEGPVKIEYGRTLLGGEPQLSFLKDIDGDGVKEIAVGYVGSDKKPVTRIYKITDSQYSLWKESDGDVVDINPDMSNRENAIRAALAHPERLQKTQIHGETYLLTGYKDTLYGESNKDNKPGRKFGGILVFKVTDGQPELFWESDEYITQTYMDFRDIDSDEISEIVWEGDLGATGRSHAFYVYRFDGDTFQLITPVQVREGTVSGVPIEYGWTSVNGLPELTFMKDVDGDGVLEITTGYYDENGDAISKIYTFNGSQYSMN